MCMAHSAWLSIHLSSHPSHLIRYIAHLMDRELEQTQIGMEKAPILLQQKPNLLEEAKMRALARTCYYH